MTGQSFDIIQQEDHQQQQQEIPPEEGTEAQPTDSQPQPVAASEAPTATSTADVSEPQTQTTAPAPPEATATTPLPPPLVEEEQQPTTTAPPQPDPIFTREEEHRMTELTNLEISSDSPLSEEERAELRQLAEKYQVFLAAGERKLREGVAPSERTVPSAQDQFVDGVTTVANTAATVAVAASQAAVYVGKGAFFWGTLVATAVPGYFGKKVGATQRFDHWNWLSDKLILGALPVVTQVGNSGNHLNLLKEQCEKRKRKLGLVVACLQEEEMQGFGLNVLTFAQKQHWAQYLGVTEYEHVPMVDFGAQTSYEAVKHAVDRMHHTMHNQGEAVYVHCKAGKGRSWMVVMCYLLTYGGMDWNTATVTVESGRHQVHPGAAQQQFAQDFCRRFQQETASGAPQPPSVAGSINSTTAE